METLPSISEIHIDTLFSQAVDKNSVEILERLIAVRKVLKEETAQAAFYAALAEFQSRCPVIQKRKKGAVAKYAPIEDIFFQVRDLLKECGFSFMITSETAEDRVTAYCKVIHKGGHSEVSSFTAHHLNRNKAISLAQLDAGTLTFAKRYAFCNAFGILTGDEDRDGEERVYITQEHLELLRRLLSQTTHTEEEILSYYNIQDISDLHDSSALLMITKLEKLRQGDSHGSTETV